MRYDKFLKANERRLSGLEPTTAGFCLHNDYVAQCLGGMHFRTEADLGERQRLPGWSITVIPVGDKLIISDVTSGQGQFSVDPVVGVIKSTDDINKIAASLTKLTGVSGWSLKDDYQSQGLRVQVVDGVFVVNE